MDVASVVNTGNGSHNNHGHTNGVENDTASRRKEKIHMKPKDFKE